MEKFVNALKVGRAFDYLANEEGNLSKAELRDIAKEAIFAAEFLMESKDKKNFYNVMEENLLNY